MAAWHDWICWALGAPFALAGAWVIWRALFADRPRGKRRCPQCWYDMRGVPGLLCPECGRHSRDETDLHRAHRRPGLAWAGVALVVAGYLGAMTPNLRKVGAPGVLPASLLMLAPTPPPVNPSDWRFADAGVAGLLAPSIWFQELVDRHDAGALWGWQERYLLRRDLDRVIFCRPLWLTGEPLCVRIGAGWFASAAAPRIVRVTPRIPGSPTAEIRLPVRAMNPSVFRDWSDVGRADFPHTLAAVPDGTTELTFDVEVLESVPGAADRVIFKGEVTRPLRVVQTPPEILTPFQSDFVDAAIRRGLRITVARAPDGKPYIHATLTRDPAIPRDVITGMRIEFLRDGQVLAWGQVRPNAWLSETSNGWVHGDMGLVADTIADRRWRARVTGSVSSSIRNFGGEKYWTGTFECPLWQIAN